MLAPLIVQCVQQEEAHCGPATVEMLFSFYGLTISQSKIARAGGMSDVIQLAPGMRLDELSQAVGVIFPAGEYALLAKYHSSLEDIVEIVEGLRLPVGIEWQGRFARNDGSAYDQGHYSVITAVDCDRRRLFIADPEDRNILTADGVIALDDFEPRWWEVDILPKPGDFSITRVSEMDHLLFVVVPADRRKPLLRLGFRPVTLALIWEFSTPLEAINE